MSEEMEGLDPTYIYKSTADPSLPRWLRTTVTKQIRDERGDIKETKYVDVLVPLDRVIRFEDDTRVEGATVILTENKGKADEEGGKSSGKVPSVYCLYSADDLDTIMDSIKEAWRDGRLIADPGDLEVVEEPTEIAP